MTDEQLHQLLRVFADQVEQVLETSAQLFDAAETGTFSTASAKRAAAQLRELAAEARVMRRLLPPSEPYLM